MGGRNADERRGAHGPRMANRVVPVRHPGPPPSPRIWRDAAAEAAATILAAGEAGYDRARMLPRLIAIDPQGLVTSKPGIGRSILDRLERALRAERRRGRSGHWTYDLNRHVALLQALAAEKRRTRRSDAVRTCRPTAPETKSAARMAGRR